MADNFLSEIFGSSGAATSTFSNLWVFVGIMILIFFVLYLYSRGTSAENIILFVLVFFVGVITEGLFDFPLLWIITPIALITLYVSVYAYYWFNK